MEEENLSSLSMSDMDEADVIIESLLPKIQEGEEGEEGDVVEISYKLRYEYGYENSPCESSFARADDLIEDILDNEFILAVRDGSFKNPVIEYLTGDDVLRYEGEDCISFLESLSRELANNPNPNDAL